MAEVSQNTKTRGAWLGRTHLPSPVRAWAARQTAATTPQYPNKQRMDPSVLGSKREIDVCLPEQQSPPVARRVPPSTRTSTLANIATAVAHTRGSESPALAETPNSCRHFAKADARTRTGDPIITSDVLYQLSYVGPASESRA